MNSSTKTLYGIGFTLAVTSLGFGIFLAYDQFRLFLALGGFSLLVIVGAALITGFSDEQVIKKMSLSQLEDLRPDLQIVSKLSKPIEQPSLLPEAHQIREFPAKCDYCHLIISPTMKVIEFGSSFYHESCWRSAGPPTQQVSPGKGKHDAI